MAGAEFVDGWFVAGVLGEGAYGEVRLLVHGRSAAQVALKAVRGAAGAREAALHAALRHPHVLRLLGTRVHAPADVTYLFLEWARGGELFQRIEPDAGMGEAEARRYWRQLLAGVGYLHGRGVAHRDIKPENLLLAADGRLLLADFGLATLFRAGGRERLLSRAAGTPPYAAPEVHAAASTPYRACPADLWSAAIVLVAMLLGEVVRRMVHAGGDGGAGGIFGILAVGLYFLKLWYRSYRPLPTSSFPFHDKDQLQHRFVAIKLPWERASAEESRYAAWVAVLEGLEGLEGGGGGVWRRVPAGALALLRRALHPAPDTRYTLDQLLNHPWTKAGGDDDRNAECDATDSASMWSSQPLPGCALPDGGELASLSQPAAAATPASWLPAVSARLWLRGPAPGALRAAAGAATARGWTWARRPRALLLHAGGASLRLCVLARTATAALLEARRAAGCGLEFRRRWAELRAALQPLAVPPPPPHLLLHHADLDRDMDTDHA